MVANGFCFGREMRSLTYIHYESGAGRCFASQPCLPTPTELEISCIVSFITMVNQRIGKDLKECTLRLWDHGWELEDIREALGVSRRSYFAGDGWFLGLVLL